MKGLSKSARRYIALLLSFVMMAMTVMTSVAAESDGWKLLESGQFVYYRDGNMVINEWVKDGGKFYYLSSDGIMCQDCWIDEVIPEKNETRWYFVDGSGARVMKTTITLDGVSYTFNEEGILTQPPEPQRKGWMNRKDGWHFYEDDGQEVRGAWRESYGVPFYLGDDGVMVTEDFVREPNGDVYYVDAQGVRVTNTFEKDEDDRWYYFRDDGKALRNTWKDLEELSGTRRYHFGEDGIMSTKQWLPSKETGYESYVGEDGSMVVDGVVPYTDGTMVRVDEEGHFVKDLKDGTYTFGGVTYTFVNGHADKTTAKVATPSDAKGVDELLETLETLDNTDKVDEGLKKQVANALLAGARDQAEDLDEDKIVSLEKVLLKAYNLNIKTEVASNSNARPDVDVVNASGLLLASGWNPGEEDIRLVVGQATPSTAEKVVFDVKLMVGEEERPLQSPVYLSVKLPLEFASAYDPSKYDYTVTHRHDDGTTDTSTANLEPNKGDVYLYLRAESFSEFELTATPKKTSEPSTTPSGNPGSYRYSSSSSSTKPTGKWQLAADGRWWYQNPDGTWPENGWAQLEWNGRTDWYYFDAEGYMVTGWITWENNRYYLHPVSDGTQGHMYTGWNEIDGKWYYFRPESGGPQGSLFVNGTTPDGYKVDANGVWVQ